MAEPESRRPDRGLADRFDPSRATAREHAANDWIAQRVGLPDLPASCPGRTPPGNYRSSTRAAAFTERPRPSPPRCTTGFFGWVDDDATGADSGYLAARHRGGAAVYRVDPAVGLLPEDVEAIRMLRDPGQYSGRPDWTCGGDILFMPGPRGQDGASGLAWLSAAATAPYGLSAGSRVRPRADSASARMNSLTAAALSG